MRRSMNWIKISFINIILVLALISLVLLTPPAMYFIKTFLPTEKILDIDLSGLDLYKNFSWSKKFFVEYVALEASYRDYITWQTDDFVGETINVAGGVRHTFQDKALKKSDKEIWFFGGSTTFGYGSIDDLTYPSIFARDNNIKTINYGSLGYITRQILENLENVIINQHQGRSEKKTTIVFFSGSMDVYTRCMAHSSKSGSAKESDLQNTVSEKKYSLSRTFSQALSFAKDLMLAVGEIQDIPYNCHSNPDRAIFVANTIVEAWHLAAAVAKADKKLFFAVLEPVSYVGEADVEYLDLDSKKNIQTTLKYQKEYDAVYSLVKKISREKGINFIDLTQVFNGCNDCYIDPLHYSPQGNKRISNALAPILH